MVRQSSPDTGAAGLTPARLGDWRRLRAALQQLGQHVSHVLGNIIPVLGKRGHHSISARVRSLRIYLLRLPRQRHGFILGSAYLNRGLAQSGDNTHILGAGIHNLMNRIVWNLER